MELVRIGDKVIDRQRIYRMVDRILELRASGLSQQDVAHELGIDRTLVSRLESLGEVRRGQKLGLVGFPVGNREALEEVARSEGVDFVWLLTEEERRRFIGERSGAALLNDLMVLIARARELDHLIFLGSDMRIRLVEALLGPDRVTGIQIGTSPITEDRFVDPEAIRQLIRQLRVPRDDRSGREPVPRDPVPREPVAREERHPREAGPRDPRGGRQAAAARDEPAPAAPPHQRPATGLPAGKA